MSVECSQRYSQHVKYTLERCKRPAAVKKIDYRRRILLSSTVYSEHNYIHALGYIHTPLALATGLKRTGTGVHVRRTVSSVY